MGAGVDARRSRNSPAPKRELMPAAGRQRPRAPPTAVIPDGVGEAHRQSGIHHNTRGRRPHAQRGQSARDCKNLLPCAPLVWNDESWDVDQFFQPLALLLSSAVTGQYSRHQRPDWRRSRTALLRTPGRERNLRHPPARRDTAGASPSSCPNRPACPSDSSPPLS